MNTKYLQVVMPFNVGIIIPKDDPVKLLNDICDELDYKNLIAQYDRTWRKYNPITMFKILVYGYMNGKYSSRDIENACRRDICFMWLLNGMPVPDHATIARFQNERLVPAIAELFCQLVFKLFEMNEIKFENLFVDGTKIEAYANKYSFVWKKAIEKYQAKLQVKIDKLLTELKSRYGFGEITVNKALEHLEHKAILDNIEFKEGKGKHKTQLQRDIELLQEYKEKTGRYLEYLSNMPNRNSLSKTDFDATFMHMKEDYMKNGQLKPGYNIQIGVESEYIVWVKSFTDRDDVNTLKPFLDEMTKYFNKIFKRVIADAGYESLENYTVCKLLGIEPYIKPTNYERAKTKKYRNNKNIVDNMPYDEKTDTFTCAQGKTLNYCYSRQRTTNSGFQYEVRCYRTESCEHCPCREICHKSKKSYREIQVSFAHRQEREECEKRITTDFGKQLRMNRSIQVEGAFGVIKEDMDFRRFLTRGKHKTTTQFFLIAFAYNILKLQNRMNSDRFNRDLFELNTA